MVCGLWSVCSKLVVLVVTFRNRMHKYVGSALIGSGVFGHVYIARIADVTNFVLRYVKCKIRA